MMRSTPLEEITPTREEPAKIRVYALNLAALIGFASSRLRRVGFDLTFLQPFLSYTNASLTTLGINSESTYDWQTREWAIPVNLTVTQLFKIGGHPITVQAGPRYWLDSPDNGPQGWGLCFAVTLLFPR